MLLDDRPLVICTDKGVVLDANHAACRLLGVERDAIVDMSLASLGRPWQRWLDRDWRATARGATRCWSQVRHESPTGVPLDLTLSAVAIQLGDATLIRIGMAADFTPVSDDLNLSAFFDTALDLLCIAHVDGRFIKVNRSWEDLLGYPAGELEGQLFLDFIHPDDLDSTLQALATLRGGDDVMSFTNRYRHHDGSYRVIEWRSRPAGKLIYAAARDVTEQRAVQERLQLAIESANAGAWDWDISNHRVYTNAIFHRMLGESEREAVGEPYFFERVHPEDRPALSEAVRQAHINDADYDIELRLRTLTGGYKWIRSTGKVVERDPTGRATRMIGQHLDVSAQRAREAAITALENRLRLFIEHTPAAVAMLDRDLRYLVASQGWIEQYGLDGVELIGQSHYEVLPILSEYWRDLHQRCLAGESLSADRDHFVGEDGRETWVRWQIKPWYDADGEIGGLVMFTDVIDQQIQHERRLADARDAAEAASRAKSEFLANMSHEMRTPMTAILGYAELLDDGAFSDNPAHAKQAIRAIHRNSQHLIQLIEDILDMSRIEAGKLRVELAPINLNRFLDNFQVTMTPSARSKRLRWTVIRDEQVPSRIVTDPIRLRQILMNLVGNAIKFTHTGAVELHVRRVRPADDGRPLDDSQPDVAQIAFEVRDTGIGMTAEQLLRISRFDAFVQADSSTTRRYGGAGLGLRISHTLAGLLGGSLGIESQPGAGSAVTLTITATEAPADATADAADELQAGLDSTRPVTADPGRATQALAGRRILIAEDGPDNQRLISALVRSAGALVEIADNGMIALNQAREAARRGQPFDLILMDMQMPEMDGYTATARLRESDDPPPPIIALTAHAMPGERERCLAAGCSAYLVKPLNRALLIETCERWLAPADP